MIANQIYDWRALQIAQLNYDRALPLEDDDTAETEWIENGVEQLLLGADVRWKRRLEGPNISISFPAVSNMTPIWRYLTQSAGMTAQTLADATGMSIQAVRADLVALESQGKVARERGTVGKPHLW